MNEKLNTLNWNNICQHLEQYCSSQLAKQLTKKITPFKTETEANQSFQDIEDVRSILKNKVEIHAQSLDDFDKWFSLIEKSSHIKSQTLHTIMLFLYEVLHLKLILNNQKENWAKKYTKKLFSPQNMIKKIQLIIDEKGIIKTTASKQLLTLYQEKQNLSHNIQKQLDKMVKDYDIEHILQDKFVTTREGRLVLPIKSGMQHNFNGLIHDSSNTQKTVFMEPQELVNSNNTLMNLGKQIDKEIINILSIICADLYQIKHELKQAHWVLLESDFLFAKAKLADELNAVSVVFSKKVQLFNLKHPLLLIKKLDPVGNDVTFNNKQRILLLSGPNAGGKTTFLQSFALAAYMASCGLPICANKNSEIIFFKHIHLILNDEQSLSEGLSSFSSHVSNLNQACKLQGPQSLIIIDEICASTNPEEAVALSKSFIEYYLDQNIFALISSHLNQLKYSWKSSSPIFQGSLNFSKKTGPNYKFTAGHPGESFAFDIAKQVGVSSEILKKALSFLSPEQKNYFTALKELEENKQKILETQETLKTEIQTWEKNNQILKEEKENFKKFKKNKLQEVMDGAEEEIQTFISEQKTRKSIFKYEELKKMQKNLPIIIKENLQPKEKTLEYFKKHYKPGTRVFISGLNQYGVIQGQVNQKGEIPLLSQSMRITVHWTALQKIES
ncbi:MAG: hypothetical protein HAW63_03320 [Bdellovibrionaceae bacterium]|nr:hypothetical protein [Pseudobdellovibrionaceae bacterium]